MIKIIMFLFLFVGNVYAQNATSEVAEVEVGTTGKVKEECPTRRDPIIINTMDCDYRFVCIDGNLDCERVDLSTLNCKCAEGKESK